MIRSSLQIFVLERKTNHFITYQLKVATKLPKLANS